jgi:hypothetical protein
MRTARRIIVRATGLAIGWTVLVNGMGLAFAGMHM